MIHFIFVLIKRAEYDTMHAARGYALDMHAVNITDSGYFRRFRDPDSHI